MRIRKEISNFPVGSPELNVLLSAFAKLKSAMQDNYEQVAGLHGMPNPSYCPHHLPEFLPWHRLYVTDLEEKLNQHSEIEISLPYWDWASEASIQNGIPELFLLQKVEIDGAEQENPLYSAFITELGRNTNRNPSEKGDLQRMAEQVNTALSRTLFDEFTNDIETPHDWLHGWVGGDMGTIAYSAYDPIFWFHHCNVDRQWNVWQQMNGNGSMSEEVLSRQLGFYDKLIKDALNTENLGFTYDVPESLIENVMEPKQVAFAFNQMRIPKPKKEILFKGFKPTQESFELRIFADKNADEKSPKDEKYISSIVLLGMGGAMNHNGFKGKFNRSIDITDTFPEIESPSQIKVVPVDLMGNPVDIHSIPLDEIVIVKRG